MGIAAALIGAALSTAFGGALTIFGTTLGIFTSFLVRAAIGLALNALTPKPKVRGANRGYQVTTRGSALDHQIIYGRMRTGGVVVYDETTGANNLYLHRVIAFAGHEVESFDEIYIDDDVLEFGGFDYTISLTRKVLIGAPRDGNYENQTSTVSISGIPTDEATFQVSDSLTKAEFDNLVRISSENDAPAAGTFVSATVSTREANTSSVIASTKYKGKVRINTHLGAADQTADADLVSESDKWTNEHRLRGIAYLYIRLQFDQNAFPNGVPDITATIKGKKVYDPREGTHDADDPSTWEWSDNPALCLRDYLSESYGLNEESANIDDTLVSTAANVCDETDTLSGETRYTCNGAFVTQVAPVDILNDLLTSMGGLLWYAQGEWRMKPAYYVAPTLSFNEDDLRSNIAVKTRHSRRSNFNIVKGTFRGEESNWQVTDYPEVTNVTDTTTSVNAGSFTYGEIYKINSLGDTDWNVVAGTTDVSYSSGDYFTAITTGSGTGTAFETTNAFLDADNGQESVLDLELPFTDNADEARRIARIVLERNRQQLTVSASFGLRAFQVQTGDIINLTIERFGWTNKEFEVTSWTFGLTDNQDLQVQMTLREISESVFDEIDDGAVYELDNTALPNPFITPAPGNLSVSDGGFTTEDGTYVNSFVVDWDAPDDAFASFYVLEWRVEGGSVFNSVRVDTTEYEIAPILENVNYEIRVKAINTFGVSGPYAAITSSVGGDITAPGLPTGFSAEGGFEYIRLKWTNPTDSDLNYIEVWESVNSSFASASQIAVVSSDTFIRSNLGINVTRYYWIRAVDYSGNKSAFVGFKNATTDFVDSADFTNEVISLFADQDLYAIEDVTGLPVSGDFIGQKVFNRTDGKLYEWNGSSWVLVVAAVEAPDISGQLATAQIEVGAVTSDLIATSAIIEEKLAALAVTEAKVAANSITTTKIANDAVEAGKLASGAVTEEKLAALAVTAAKVASNAITTAKIAAGAVTEGELATGAVTEIKIATSAITETKIASDAITTPKIAAGAVTAGEIAAGAVTAGKVAAGAVTATEIAAGTITSNEIATNTITATNIAAGTITGSELAAGSVSSDKITANSITSDKIVARTIQASDLATGTITSNEIATNTITATNIAAGAISTSELAASAITSDKIAANSITSSKIVAGTIQASDIAVNAITADEIAANTITGNEIAANTITSANILAGTITADEIAANTITGGLLATSGIITDSAQIDNAVITNAKIEDLAVDTIKIADNAVTIHDEESFSTVTGAGPHEFDTNFTMQNPGTVTVIFTVISLGTAGSGDNLTITASVNGRNVLTIPPIASTGINATGTGAVGVYTLIMSGDITSSDISSNPLGFKVDITVTTSGVTNPSAECNYVIMKRFK